MASGCVPPLQPEKSAPTEYERRDLVLRELQRTGAFERGLLIVISPTGTGYVNYVAVEAAEYMTRGNIASVTMQYSLRPSALSLDRVAEGRLQYRMLIDAIHNQLAERPAGQRPRVVIFGESLGAWTSQDAFEHRGTQGLLDAAIDRAIWIGTPYMSKWKQEALGSDRPDVDPSLLRRFNDFGQLPALARPAREQLRYVMITHDDNGGVALLWPGSPRPGARLARTCRDPARGRPEDRAVAEPGYLHPDPHRHEEFGERDPRPVRGEGTTTGPTSPGSSGRYTPCRPAMSSWLPSKQPCGRTSCSVALLRAHHPNKGDVAETGRPEQRDR